MKISLVLIFVGVALLCGKISDQITHINRICFQPGNPKAVWTTVTLTNMKCAMAENPTALHRVNLIMMNAASTSKIPAVRTQKMKS